MTRSELLNKLQKQIKKTKTERNAESCKGTRQAYLDGVIHGYKQVAHLLDTDNWEEEPTNADAH